MTELVAVLTQALNKNRIPVIALKSGTVIRLWEDDKLRENLCTENLPSTLEHTMLPPSGESWATAVPGTSTLPRLCADAQLKVFFISPLIHSYFLSTHSCSYILRDRWATRRTMCLRT